MNHPFFARPGGRPLVFAHRGGSGLAPENTLAAFDRGLDAGADGLELDVHLTRDGQVVVLHDATLARTTNLAAPVADLTAADLAAADAGYRFERDGRFPFRGGGIGVPMLADVLARYRRVPIIIELKVNTAAMAEAAAAVVRRAGALDRVCFGAAGLRVLRAIRRLEPSTATSAARAEVRLALYRSWVRWPIGPGTRVPYQGFQVPERAGVTRVVTERFVREAHAAGLGVQAWTVDREADARRLLAWGVDAIITDRPDVMAPLVREDARGRGSDRRAGPTDRTAGAL